MYDDQFYDTINDGSYRSARTVVPVVQQLLHPETVLDLGCGEGVWLSVFAEHGCVIHGVDHGINPDRLRIPAENFTAFDLSQGPHLPPTRWTYDLAVSLEVAEHLPPERADWLVHALTAASNVVLFSAAIPGQGGTGHVHEKWPAYWAQKFLNCDYAVTGALRWLFWDRAPDEIENWYTQNLLLCVQSDELHTQRQELVPWFDGPHAAPLAVVHPVLWDSRR
jgi:hypothetical protein